MINSDADASLEVGALGEEVRQRLLLVLFGHKVVVNGAVLNAASETDESSGRLLCTASAAVPAPIRVLVPVPVPVPAEIGNGPSRKR